MIGITQMTISKEQMIAIVEHYLNTSLLNTTFKPEHKAKVVDQIRKSGDRFVITFEGEMPKNAERSKPFDSDLSRPTTEAIGGAEQLSSEVAIA